MSGSTTGIPIGQLPVLGAVTDDSYVVGEHAGSGLFSALALKSYGAAGNIGRNCIHNCMFNVQQRGTGSWTTAATYTADRWKQDLNGGTQTGSIVSLNDADRTQIGDEAAKSGLQFVVAGGAAAANYSVVTQSVEDVRRLSGKTVIVSLWAKAVSGTPKMGLSVDQYFGTGGSPSAYVSGTGQSVTLSTTWTRFSATFSVASTSGKVLGTNNDHGTVLNIWFSSGTTYNASAGNVGVQSATFILWGVQLEIGSVSTPLERPDPRYDLANCQRFFVSNIVLTGAATAAAANAWFASENSLPVVMRATPTLTLVNNNSSNILTPVAGTHYGAQNNQLMWGGTQSAAAGVLNWTWTLTCSADL